MSLNKIEKFEEFEKYLLGQYKAMNPLRLKKSKSLSLIKKECKKLSEEDKKIYIEKVKKEKEKIIKNNSEITLLDLTLKQTESIDTNLNRKLNTPIYKFDNLFKISNNKMNNSYLKLFMHICKKYNFKKYKN
jgi:hypothetical protein